VRECPAGAFVPAGHVGAIGNERVSGDSERKHEYVQPPEFDEPCLHRENARRDDEAARVGDEKVEEEKQRGTELRGCAGQFEELPSEDQRKRYGEPA
jgi:hypothetical protein